MHIVHFEYELKIEEGDGMHDAFLLIQDKYSRNSGRKKYNQRQKCKFKTLTIEKEPSFLTDS